jgi:predicted RNA-binding protein with TRAM domain
MKYINKHIYVSLFAFAMFLWSCGDEEPILYSEGDFVAFNARTATISENGGTRTVQINRSTRDLSGTLTVQLSVSAEYTTTTSFFDQGDEASGTYALSGTEVTFAEGESVLTVDLNAIDDVNASGNKLVNISITSVSDNSYAVGTPGPDQLFSTYAITLVDDDCPTPDIVGDFPVTTTGTSPAGCEGVTNTVTVTKVSDNADGTTTYLLSDVTGGLYLNCYSAADNPGEIVVDGLSITLTAQPDVVYGGDQFDGTGSINTCDETMTLNWSNGYGDMGSTLFTL